MGLARRRYATSLRLYSSVTLLADLSRRRLQPDIKVPQHLLPSYQDEDDESELSPVLLLLSCSPLTFDANSGAPFGVASFLPLRQPLHRSSPLHQHFQLPSITHYFFTTSAPFLAVRARFHDPLHLPRNDPAEPPIAPTVPAYSVWRDEGEDVGRDGVG